MDVWNYQAMHRYSDGGGGGGGGVVIGSQASMDDPGMSGVIRESADILTREYGRHNSSGS